jgi:hypothetical protein
VYARDLAHVSAYTCTSVRACARVRVSCVCMEGCVLFARHARTDCKRVCSVSLCVVFVFVVYVCVRAIVHTRVHGCVRAYVHAHVRVL